MAINNGEDANSNTEVDNVVSIGVTLKIVEKEMKIRKSVQKVSKEAIT